MATTPTWASFNITPGLLCGNRAEEADMPTDFATIELPASEFFGYIWLMKEWDVTASAAYTTASPSETHDVFSNVEGKFTYANLSAAPDPIFTYGTLEVRNSDPIETVCGKCRRRVRVDDGDDVTDTSVDDYLIPSFIISTDTVSTGSLTVSDGSEVGNCSFDTSYYGGGGVFGGPLFSFSIGSWCFISGGNVRVEVQASLARETDTTYNIITTAIAQTGWTQLGSTFTGTVFGQNITMRVLFNDAWVIANWADIPTYEANVTVTDPAFSYDIDVTEFWVPT